jgi:hypothetical protein
MHHDKPHRPLSSDRSSVSPEKTTSELYMCISRAGPTKARSQKVTQAQPIKEKARRTSGLAASVKRIKSRPKPGPVQASGHEIRPRTGPTQASGHKIRPRPSPETWSGRAWPGNFGPGRAAHGQVHSEKSRSMGDVMNYTSTASREIVSII